MVSKFSPNTTVEVPLIQQTWGDNQVQVVAGHGSPAAVASPNPGGAQTVDERKEAQIFICAIVGRAMGSGKFETQDVSLLTKAALAAWNDVKDKL
jgi:hypothetical protein